MKDNYDKQKILEQAKSVAHRDILKGKTGLVIDDDEQVRESLKDKFEFEWGMEIFTASSGAEALDILDKNQNSALFNKIMLLFVDYNMPEMNGIEFLQAVKKRIDMRQVVKVILTGYATIDSAMESLNEGLADMYLQKPLKGNGQEAIKRKITAKVLEADILKNLPETLSDVMGLKSENLDSHVKNVAKIAENMALKILELKKFQELNLSTMDVAGAYYAGILHDIGKIKVPEEILNKPGKLSEEQMKLMRDHIWIAAEYIAKFPYLHRYMEAVVYHHENWDGSGYIGLKDQKIPFLARILRIADSFDAIVSRRTYNMSDERRDAKSALEDIKSKAGEWYDPDLIPVFENVLKKMKWL